VKRSNIFFFFCSFAGLLKLDKFCTCLNTWNFDIFSNVFVLLDLYLVMGRVESRKVWNARSPSIADLFYFKRIILDTILKNLKFMFC
jgi:hypothetical protein